MYLDLTLGVLMHGWDLTYWTGIVPTTLYNVLVRTCTCLSAVLGIELCIEECVY